MAEAVSKRVTTNRIVHLALTALFLYAAATETGAQSVADTEWRHFGHDAANTKYSPLDQITPDNFNDLEIAWRWTSIETEVTSEREELRPGPFKSVSLMVEGLVYLSTSLSQVAALDAGTHHEWLRPDAERTSF